MSQPASVSVIIVTYNSQSSVFGCLDALRSVARVDGLEVIVVDNQSKDQAPDRIRREYQQVRLLFNDRNRGFASACNLGAREATGQYLLFLNPDVVLDRDAIANLEVAARSRPKVGAVTGRLRFPDGAFQANCRRFPTIGNMLFSRGSALGKLFFNRQGSGGQRYTLPDCEGVAEVPAVAGTMMLIRRDLFQLARGFDTRFFMFLEDTDLCLRLSQSGFVNLFVPQAGAIHGWGKGSDAGKLRRAWHHHQSIWRYFLKHYPNGFSLILLPVLLTVNFVAVCMLPERRR